MLALIQIMVYFKNMNMNKLDVIEGNKEEQCECCGRTHRKLFWTQHGWMGQTCKENFKSYRSNRMLNDNKPLKPDPIMGFSELQIKRFERLFAV